MNNIDKALQSITGNNPNREWINQPFEIEDMVYATDTMIAARVKKSEVLKYLPLKESNITSVVSIFDLPKNSKLKIDVAELEKIISKIPKTDEYENCDQKASCEECGGIGQVEWNYETHYMDYNCPICYGTGDIEKEKRIKTGRKIMQSGHYIDIGVCRFSGEKIKTLVDFLNIINETKLEVLNQREDYNSTLFRSGKIEIVLMPVMKDENHKVINKFE